MYAEQAQNAADAGGGDGDGADGADGAAKGGDTVDAEFEEVKDEDKK